jgi:hypothetical protein
MIRTGATLVELAVAGHSGDLERLLDRHDAAHIVATDLSLGSARGFQAPRELCAQLGIAIDINVFGRRIDLASDAAQQVAAWVDAEGRGASVIATAHDLADRVAAAASLLERTVILVLLPRFQDTLAAEDGWFLYFLAAACEQGAQTLLFLQAPGAAPTLPPGLQARAAIPAGAGAAGAAPAPAGDLLAFFPGVLADIDLVRLAEIGQLRGGACLQLEGGYYLVGPEHRIDIAAADDASLLALQQYADEAGWLQAFALFHRCRRGVNLAEAEHRTLVAQAWSRAGEGGLALAEAYLQQAAEEARRRRSPLYGRIVLDLQSLRIAAQRFEAAADCALDDALCAAALASDLHLTRAWGQIMCGRAAEAEHSFARADPLALGTARSAIDLYLLNIFALSEFRAGRIDSALSIEQGIARRLAVLPAPNYHLQYINHFNLARLFRAVGDEGQCRHHLAQVFFTTDGLRTEGDAVYFNMTLGSLCQKTGDAAAALRHYWLASVHLLAAGVPEALGWRTLLSFFGKRVQPQPDTPARVAAALHELLATAAAAAAGFDAGRVPPRAPTCRYALASRARIAHEQSQRRLWLAPGFGSLISTAASDIMPAFDSDATERLARLTTSVFEWHARLPPGACGDGILIDDGFGTEVASALPEAIPAALRWHAVAIEVAGQGSLAPSADGLRYTVGPAVSATRSGGAEGQQQLVAFKRYRSEATLHGPAASVLSAIVDGLTRFPDIHRRVLQAHPSVSGDDCMRLLGRLETQRIVCVRSEAPAALP